MIICIADLPVYWQTDYAQFVKDFASCGGEQPVVSLEFIQRMNEIHSIQYTDKPSERLLRLENGELLFSDGEWRNCTVYTSRRNNSEHSLPLAAICSAFSKHNALFMHASVVDLNGSGIIFAGYSGVGKTTQAQLWEKHLGARIINGDKAFVRCMDDGFFAYGCPWKGSSEYCLNERTQLRGIVVLRQAAQNRITRLESGQAVELFMPHVFLPHWDSDCLGKSLDTFNRLVEDVPVWLLECRADEEAVRLTHGKVF